jgi:hypothetical protein
MFLCKSAGTRKETQNMLETPDAVQVFEQKKSSMVFVCGMF